MVSKEWVLEMQLIRPGLHKSNFSSFDGYKNASASALLSSTFSFIKRLLKLGHIFSQQQQMLLPHLLVSPFPSTLNHTDQDQLVYRGSASLT